MADVITRFKLETTQYDSKLRDASKGLAEYTRQATLAGNEFGKFTQKNVEAARALGSITPSATNAKDKVKELVGAFNDAAKAYNALTKEQQQSDFGKAMAQSIGQLSQKIREAKSELYDLDKAAKDVHSGGGLFAGLGDKMSGALQVFGGNMLTKAAGAVANIGSEMADAVKQGIELAKAGEGIRNAFERLGRGDILDGLRQATHGTVTDLELMKAAVKFNDFKLPLDELGTMLAFAQQKAKDTGQSVDYMVDSIVTGLGRKSLMILDNLGLSATEVKERMAETGDMTKAVGDIIREQMAKAGDYVETAADRAAQANVNLQNKMEELGRKFAPLQEASDNLWTSMKIGIMDVIGGPLTDLLNKLTEAGRMASAYGVLGGNAKVGRMTANLSSAREENRQSIYQQQQQQFWRYINPREQQIKDIRAWQSGQRGEALQGRIAAITEKYGSLDVTKIQAEVDAAKKMLADYQQAAKQILQPIKQEITPTITTSGGATGGGGGSSRGGSRGGFDVSKIAFDPNKAALAAVKMPEPEGGSEAWNTMREAITGCKEEMADYSAETANWTKNFDPYRESMDKMTTAAKEQQKAFSMGAEAAANLGAAFASMEDPAAKAAGTVISAIASIALGFAQAAAAKDTTASGWAWLAWLAAGTAAMATTISTVHSLTGYQNGGMIKGYSTGGTIQGNSYSGDNIGGLVDGSQLVGLNAGEVVLNAAQQNTLAQTLSGNMRSIHVVGKISGTDIILSADRTLMTQGKQLAVWGR